MATAILHPFAALGREINQPEGRKKTLLTTKVGRIGHEGWEKGYNVLVLDDYEINIKVMKLFLDLFGFNYKLTRTAKECLKAYKAGKYDVAILDLMMPEMNGFDVAKFIRHYEKYNDIKSIKLIAYSASADIYAAKCKDVGFDELLVKPVTMDETYKVLKRCLL